MSDHGSRLFDFLFKIIQHTFEVNIGNKKRKIQNFASTKVFPIVFLANIFEFLKKKMKNEVRISKSVNRYFKEKLRKKIGIP